MATYHEFTFINIYIRQSLYFRQALQKFKEELEQDTIIKYHLETLYDKLLEGNLLRIIEPYSHVQVPHVAKLINLDKVGLMWVVFDILVRMLTLVLWYMLGNTDLYTCCDELHVITFQHVYGITDM